MFEKGTGQLGTYAGQPVTAYLLTAELAWFRQGRQLLVLEAIDLKLLSGGSYKLVIDDRFLAGAAVVTTTAPFMELCRPGVQRRSASGAITFV